MRSTLACLGIALQWGLAGVVPVHATSAEPAQQDWRQELSTRIGKHPAPRAVKATYAFGWSGVKAADSSASFSRKKSTFELELKAQTSGFARSLWQMDTEAKSTVNAATLRPVKLTQTEKYSRQKLDMSVDFTPKGPRWLKVETPSDGKKPKAKTWKFARVHDLHSAYLFIRSQRLKPGDTVRLCVFPSSSPYYAEITAGTPTKLKATGKEWDAIPCSIRLREIGKDFTLAPHTKFKKATVWISDDRDRLILRIEADVFIGQIWAELQSIDFPKGKSK